MDLIIVLGAVVVLVVDDVFVRRQTAVLTKQCDENLLRCYVDWFRAFSASALSITLCRGCVINTVIAWFWVDGKVAFPAFFLKFLVMNLAPKSESFGYRGY